MKKVAILVVLALAGALVGIACGGEAAPAKDPSGATTTTSSGGPEGSAEAPAGSAAPAST
jgi:ABC-type glycerol-3-phosphate transport system substrate-binding protein